MKGRSSLSPTNKRHHHLARKGIREMKHLLCQLRWLLRKRGRDRGLLFSRNNIRIDRDLDYSANEVCAYIEVWFNPEKKFGLRLYYDDSIDVYAIINPETGDLRLIYIIHYADGGIDDVRLFRALTQEEKAVIKTMVEEVSLIETGMSVKDHWLALMAENEI
jgi:hypothetical protein